MSLFWDFRVTGERIGRVSRVVVESQSGRHRYESTSYMPMWALIRCIGQHNEAMRDINVNPNPAPRENAPVIRLVPPNRANLSPNEIVAAVEQVSYTNAGADLMLRLLNLSGWSLGDLEQAFDDIKREEELCRQLNMMPANKEVIRDAEHGGAS